MADPFAMSSFLSGGPSGPPSLTSNTRSEAKGTVDVSGNRMSSGEFTVYNKSMPFNQTALMVGAALVVAFLIFKGR